MMIIQHIMLSIMKLLKRPFLELCALIYNGKSHIQLTYVYLYYNIAFIIHLPLAYPLIMYFNCR